LIYETKHRSSHDVICLFLQAVEVVSNCISKRDFTTLQGLVTNDVLEQVKLIVSDLSDNEIKDMAFDNDDMYLFLPVQLDIINDTKREYAYCNRTKLFMLFK